VLAATRCHQVGSSQCAGQPFRADVVSCVPADTRRATGRRRPARSDSQRLRRRRHRDPAQQPGAVLTITVAVRVTLGVAVEPPAHVVDVARPVTTPTASAQGPAGSASAALAGLTIKGRAPKTGYDRDLFGPAWADVDRNGCPQRHLGPGPDRGKLPARRPQLRRTHRHPDRPVHRPLDRLPHAGAVQIDHVVSLSDAWQKGAQQWEPGKRLAFANDPLNLLAVDGPTNASKSDADAATWLPPNLSYRCPLVARQVAVKLGYGPSTTRSAASSPRAPASSCPRRRRPRRPAGHRRSQHLLRSCGPTV